MLLLTKVPHLNLIISEARLRLYPTSISVSTVKLSKPEYRSSRCLPDIDRHLARHYVWCVSMINIPSR